MTDPEGNSFVFPTGLMFPKMKSWETLKLERKQIKLFPKGKDIKYFVI